MNLKIAGSNSVYHGRNTVLEVLHVNSILPEVWMLNYTILASEMILSAVPSDLAWRYIQGISTMHLQM